MHLGAAGRPTAAVARTRACTHELCCAALRSCATSAAVRPSAPIVIATLRRCGCLALPAGSDDGAAACAQADRSAAPSRRRAAVRRIASRRVGDGRPAGRWRVRRRFPKSRRRRASGAAAAPQGPRGSSTAPTQTNNRTPSAAAGGAALDVDLLAVWRAASSPQRGKDGNWRPHANSIPAACKRNMQQAAHLHAIERP